MSSIIKKAFLSTLSSLSLVSLMLAPSISAAAEQKGWIGVLGGLSVPSQDESTTRPILAVSGGAKMGSELGIGAYLFTSSKDEDAPLGKFNYDLYGVELAYHFEGEAKGVYLGGRLGTSKIKASGETASPFHVGAVAGFNHFLQSRFSVGGEVNYFSVTSANDVDGFGMLNFVGSAKFWF